MLKGNLLVAQSGGPTPVINASLVGILRAARNQSKINVVYGLRHGIEGALKDEVINLTDLSTGFLDRLAITPSSALGSCRHKLLKEDYERIIKMFRSHNIRYFVYIGGNDSMDICHQISALAMQKGYELQVIGVPKTIDNDLAYTDHSPGYASAARFVAFATRDTGLDLEAMSTFDDVTILETMGRDAGWLAAASILAKDTDDAAPHLIYLPEIPFYEENFISKVIDTHDRLGRVYIVVSEGLRAPDGSYVGKNSKSIKDSFGHSLPTLTSGIAAYLVNLIHQRLKLQARFLRHVLIGRVFTPCVSIIDYQEALQIGQAALESLINGKTGLMMTLNRSSENSYHCDIGTVSLDKVANAVKKIPAAWIDVENASLRTNFKEYVTPLIGEPLSPIARL